LPYIVATARDEESGSEVVVGYAYANLFRARTAYRFTLEHSIYVDEKWTGRRGIGRALLSELMRLLEQAGYRHLLAVIGDSANAASIGLHTRAGFKHVGKLEQVGFKFGRWIDVVLMQKQLGEGADSVPKETLPCEELPSA
jgi:phosphinothricin acetyltransferase